MGKSNVNRERKRTQIQAFWHLEEHWEEALIRPPAHSHTQFKDDIQKENTTTPSRIFRRPLRNAFCCACCNAATTRTSACGSRWVRLHSRQSRHSIHSHHNNLQTTCVVARSCAVSRYAAIASSGTVMIHTAKLEHDERISIDRVMEAVANVRQVNKNKEQTNTEMDRHIRQPPHPHTHIYSLLTAASNRVIWCC